jgi:hypothetical protein
MTHAKSQDYHPPLGAATQRVSLTLFCKTAEATSRTAPFSSESRASMRLLISGTSATQYRFRIVDPLTRGSGSSISRTRASCADCSSFARAPRTPTAVMRHWASCDFAFSTQKVVLLGSGESHPETTDTTATIDAPARVLIVIASSCRRERHARRALDSPDTYWTDTAS